MVWSFFFLSFFIYFLLFIYIYSGLGGFGVCFFFLLSFLLYIGFIFLVIMLVCLRTLYLCSGSGGV